MGHIRFLTIWSYRACPTCPCGVNWLGRCITCISTRVLVSPCDKQGVLPWSSRCKWFSNCEPEPWSSRAKYRIIIESVWLLVSKSACYGNKDVGVTNRGGIRLRFRRLNLFPAAGQQEARSLSYYCPSPARLRHRSLFPLRCDSVLVLCAVRLAFGSKASHVSRNYACLGDSIAKQICQALNADRTLGCACNQPW